MNTTIGRLVCFLVGHLRGKRLSIGLDREGYPAYPELVMFRCQRCGAKWTRKARKAT